MMDNVKELLVGELLLAIGEDNTREGLLDTPSRVVKSWGTLFGGYKMNPKVILERRFAPDNYDQMVILRDIEMYSFCEHHMLPFYGKVHIAYIPGEQVVGLSKLARLVELYARRPQVQERITQQVADALMEYADAKGVIVVTECEHMCMAMRGVNKPASRTITSAVRGVMRTPATRAEAMSLIMAKH